MSLETRKKALEDEWIRREEAKKMKKPEIIKYQRDHALSVEDDISNIEVHLEAHNIKYKTITIDDNHIVVEKE